MSLPVDSIPKPFAAGILLALLAILLGFGLGGVFGAAEDQVKQVLDGSGTAVLDTVYGGDVAKKDAVVAKSWSYLQRAHLHGGGIGTAAMASSLVLLLLSRRGPLACASALAFGAGALIYSCFWLWAAFKAPGLGSTGAAKEALEFIAVPGAGLSMLGAAGTLLVVVRDALLTGSAGRSVR